MKSNQKISRFLKVLLDINVPGLIMSSPGLGKTSTVEMFCRLYDINLTTLIASQYAPDDILGIQSVKDGKLVRLSPSWFDDMIDIAKNGKRNILFIDEITTCDDFIQAPLLNLIFNKSLGKSKLPDNTLIIAAGNYPEDLNNAFNLSNPLVNRFLVLNLTKKDYDIKELMNGEFDRINSEWNPSEVENFLGMKVSGVRDYSPLKKNLKSLISNQAEVGKTKVLNSNQTGLVGFSSTRSIRYSLSFMTSCLNQFGLKDKELLGGVMGDSLGETKSGVQFKELFMTTLNEYEVKHQYEITDQLVNDLENCMGISPSPDCNVVHRIPSEAEITSFVYALISEPSLITEKYQRIVSQLHAKKLITPELYGEFSRALIQYLG